jgi:hypothetical protein
MASLLERVLGITATTVAVITAPADIGTRDIPDMTTAQDTGNIIAAAMTFAMQIEAIKVDTVGATDVVGMVVATAAPT